MHTSKLFYTAAFGFLLSDFANAVVSCPAAARDTFETGEAAYTQQRLGEARSLYEQATEACDFAEYWQALGQSYLESGPGPDGEMVEQDFDSALESFGNAFAAARKVQDDTAGGAAARSVVEVGLLAGDPIKANSWLIIASQLDPEHPDLPQLQQRVDAEREQLSTTEINTGLSGTRGLGTVNQLLGGSVSASTFWNPEAAGISQQTDNATDENASGGMVISVSIPIKFESNSTEVTLDTARNIENLAKALATQSDTVQITLIGHADLRGEAAYNLNLSRARAEQMQSAILKLEPTLDGRVHAVGRGSSQPVDPGATDRAHANNRRLEVTLSDQG